MIAVVSGIVGVVTFISVIKPLIAVLGDLGIAIGLSYMISIAVIAVSFETLDRLKN